MTEFKPTPGPWIFKPGLDNCSIDVDDEPILGTIVGDEWHIARIWRDVPEAKSNARLIAAALVMYQKIKDTVEWLEREIENREGILRGILVEVEIASLKELRDSLAETLRQIEEGL